MAGRYTFGRFELQHAEGRLLESGKPLAVSMRALDLLAALVSREGLATKKELLQAVWPGMVVEENTLQAQVSSLRKLLGADSILTVSGRGYRFALDVVAFEHAATATAHQDNLPTAVTSFVRRVRESAEIALLLSRSRLLTIIGTGGCGKTRLAVHAATERRSPTRAIWFVDLAALTDARLIAQRLASVMGVVEQPGQSVREAIAERLDATPALLLLDNAEHVLAGCAAFVDESLSRSAQVSFLVTSRERLGIVGEQTYRVPSLSLPDASHAPSPEGLLASEAVTLFVERAKILRPHFALDASNAAVVAAICRRLDGIPLAIELAAPRARAMSLEEIDQRLDRRFSLLMDGTNTSVPRQRTLRSTIDWSFELLTPNEQAVFCRASVFAGSWDLESAEAVCTGGGVEVRDMLDILVSLVDKHLFVSEQKGGIERYRMLESLRQYASERLTESATELKARRDRHLAHFTALSEAAEPGMLGSDQIIWFDRLDVEHDNLRTALTWALSGDGDIVAGLMLGGCVWRFWFTRGHTVEGGEWLSRLLQAAPSDAPAAFLAKVNNGSGALAMIRADLLAAAGFFEKVLEIRRALGDRSSVGGALNNLAAAVHGTGDVAAAKLLIEEGLQISRELGEQHNMATGLHNLGDMARDLKDFGVSRKYYEESLALNRALAQPAGIAGDLAGLGVLAAHRGDYAAARQWLVQGLAALWSLGDRWRVSTAMGELAMVAAWSGLNERAATLWGATERLREEIGAPFTASQEMEYEQCVSDARAASGKAAAFEACWRQGGAMDLDRAVRYATESAPGWEID
jgi:predicted ATPase/DNA-binding winged helix-turn-helix (wHTH) protein